MRNHDADRAGGIVPIVLLTAALVAVSAFVFRQSSALAALTEPRTNQLMKLGLKFGGAAGCAAAKCHGEAAPPANKGDRLANQNAVWKEKDRHAQAFASLSGEEGKAIAQRMGIAATDVRCTTCHTVDLDKYPTLAGEKYSKAEGVTCTACHGPDERWEKPHQEKGWVDKTRKQYAGNPQKMLAEWGLYDTKSPLLRAEMCASCHLAIDASLVGKGKHPQPKFELEYYSTIEPKHWEEPGGVEKVRRWVVGQAVCVRDGMRQLGERARGGDAQLTRDGYQQAMAHLAILRHGLTAMGGAATAFDQHAAKIQTAMAGNDMAALGAAADAAAAAAEGAFDSIEKLQPAPPAVAKLMNNLAGDAALANDFGTFGMDQQVYGLYALYAGYATTPGNTADRAVAGKIRALFPKPKAAPTPADQFAAALAAIKQDLAKLPQQ